MSVISVSGKATASPPTVSTDVATSADNGATASFDLNGEISLPHPTAKSIAKRTRTAVSDVKIFLILFPSLSCGNGEFRYRVILIFVVNDVSYRIFACRFKGVRTVLHEFFNVVSVKNVNIR